MSRWLLGVILLAALAPAAAQDLVFDQSAQAVAQAYMRASADGDRQTLLKLRPSHPAGRFGPPLFCALPTFASPRVDAHRAVITFDGKPVDASLPVKGMIVLTKVDEEPAGWQWKVKQIFWLDGQPLGVSVPKRSVTKADTAQEPWVTKAGQAYVRAWLKKDYATMDRLCYDTLTRRQSAKSYFRLRGAEFAASPTTWGELRVNFVARVTVLRMLPKTVEGTFFMLKEAGEWKVRGNALSL